jgi:hypothetical protein
MKLIGEGELLKSAHKKFAETIIFVPFYFGKKAQLKRHAEFVNELGFDCVIFNLSSNLPLTIPKFLPNIKNGWGIKHLWTQEIIKILDAIPGNKIFYAFSNPSSSALEATEIRKAKDIKAIICDGGPFYDLLQCNWNFFSKEFKVPTIFGKIAANAFARSIWSVHHEKELKQSLDSLPAKFPLMSIRGWQDHLVPPTAIEKAFNGHTQIDLEILNLPQGGHMDGLKKFPTIYKPRVTDFLKSVGTKK